jgi:hypothetical protein
MKQNWIIIIFVGIILIAVFTNPSTEEHKQAVKSVVNQLVQNSVSDNNSNLENLGVLLGSSLAEKLVENSVTRDNYILFSITKISWKGESRNIGYGLFGNVFLSEKIKDAFKDKSEIDSEAYEDFQEIDSSIIDRARANSDYQIEEIDTAIVEAIDTGYVD